MDKILAIGDLHFRPSLGYSEYVKDQRIPERQEILDFIVKQSEDCSIVVFLGDQFHVKNPMAETTRDFTAFLERLGNKQIHLLVGNHEVRANGASALDYLKEIKGKKWHIVNGIEKVDDMVFCSYQNKLFLETEDNKSGQDKLLKLLPSGRVLFTHQAVSDTLTNCGTNTDIFDEIILPKELLEKRYELSVSGHIHKASVSSSGKTIVAGSIFNQEIGEIEKCIWKVNPHDLSYEKIKLPGRPIYKFEDPKLEDLKSLPTNSIVKIILTEKLSEEKLAEINNLADNFDALIVVEHIKRERNSNYNEETNLLDLSMESLLEVYAKQNNLDVGKLKQGFDLVKDTI